MSKIQKRKEIGLEQTWDLSEMFKSKADFLHSLKDAQSDTKKILKYKGRLTENSSTLYSALVTLEKFMVALDTLDTYAYLNEATDATNVENQELLMQYEGISTEIQTDITFFNNEIMTLTDNQLLSFFKSEPKLERYRTFLEDILEEKQFKLSDDTEEALAALGEVTSSPYKIYSVSKAADMVFDSFEDSEGTSLANSFNLFEGKYEFSEDKAIRRNAYASFNRTLNQYKNTYAAVYSTEVKKQVTISKLRGYPSVTTMLLRSQKVTEEMYNRQIDVIYENLAPHMRKFAKLLKEQQGLETLRFCDLKAPLDTSYNPGSTFEETKEVILKALGIMGEDYVDIMKKAFNERWIDYADNIGKSSGAFCASPYASHPLILVTFQNNMRDAFTLVHELGHAGHFYLANKEQNYFNTSPSMFNVEAPSTMNEMLLGRYLLKNSDDPKMKKWVILQFMGTYYHNFVTHLLEAAYQRKVYAFAEEGQPLTAQLLTETKLGVLKGFWGDSVEIDDDAGLTWMRQPHYYMGLYPYTYSAGLTASTAVSEMIYEEGQPAVDRWIEMLKTGGKLKPIELLKVAGMDFTSDEPVEKAVAFVGKLIDQLVELSN